MKKIGDDELLVKYKNVGWDDERIGKKLGISPEEVDKRFKSLIERAERIIASGLANLQTHFGITCNQYQLLGDSLKVVAEAFSNAMTPDEIRELIVDDKEETLRNLTKMAIVLKPFIASSPQEALKNELEKN